MMLHQEDMNGNEEVDARMIERGSPEGSFEDPSSPLEMEESETGRKTSIFKYYSYKNAGEFFPCVRITVNQICVNKMLRDSVTLRTEKFDVALTVHKKPKLCGISKI